MMRPDRVLDDLERVAADLAIELRPVNAKPSGPLDLQRQLARPHVVDAETARRTAG